jgi:hypothetical protein
LGIHEVFLWLSQGDIMKLTPYNFDRNDEVLSLLDRVFNPWDGGNEYFSWKYKFNTDCNFNFPRGWIVEQDGKIVAFNGYLPRKIKIKNREFWALQSFDTATDPGCRGQGLFGKLQQLIYEEVEASKIPWIYGWASEMGFKVFTQKVGWTVWGKQRYLMRLLDPVWFLETKKITNRVLARVGGKALDLYFRESNKLIPSKSVQIRKEFTFPESVTKLCRKWSENFDLIALRDKQYLDWRLSNPLVSQRLMCAFEKGQLKGYVVYKLDSGDALDVMDCVWEDTMTLYALLKSVEEYGRSVNKKIIRFRISTSSIIEQSFKKAGYFWSNTEFPMIGHCVMCDDNLKELLLAKNKSVYWSYFDRNE